MEKRIITNDDAKINIVILTNPLNGERIKGISKCHADDIYDRDKGIAIANARAWINYYKSLKRTNKQYLTAAERIIKELTSHKNNYEAIINNSNDKIATLEESLAELLREE